MTTETQEYLGCGDSMCVFGPPQGQHTNGGCRCLKYLDEPKNVMRVRRAIMQLRAENRGLKAALMSAKSS